MITCPNRRASRLARISTVCAVALTGLAGAGVVSIVVAGGSAEAQALRARSSASVAAGPTSDRNSIPTPSTTGLPGASARQSITTGTGSNSAASILGMPLRVAAPVEPAYNGEAGYSTFAGQPMRSQDAVLQQSIDGAP